MKKTIMNTSFTLTRNQRRSAAVFLLICFLPTGVLALPVAPQVVNGTAAINVSGPAMTVTNSANAIINWQSFSIGQGESARFIQPSAASAVLNRITGGDPSHILGTLQSNGRILLINPNGILFGANSRVDVNGLTASTLDISNQDFLAGRMKFNAGPVAGTIEHQGAITTPAGGQVYLIAPAVANSGVITAPNGDVMLAAGKEVLLVDKNSPEIALVVSAPEHQALNLGTLVADAGRIGMYGGIVRQKGLVNADSAVRDAGGRIFLKATGEATVAAGSTTSANGMTGGTVTVQASEGTALVSGVIEAKGHDGNGGTVTILGQRAGLIDDAIVDVNAKTGRGAILIGGDYQGGNPDVQNAQAAYVGKGTTIHADAMDTGDGGKVIIWSDDATRVYGSISARGGSNGGNGGFVETSGKGYLDFRGHVDTTAAAGKGGTLLLDPTDITITALGGAPTAGSFSLISTDQIFDGGVNNSSSMGWDYLNGLLSGNNVIVRTNSTAAGTGNINFAQAGVSAGGSNSLTFQAENNISVNGDIQFTSSGTLSLLAGGTITQTAPVSAAVVRTSSVGGTILNNASNAISSFSAANSGSGNIELTNTAASLMLNGLNINQSGGGNVIINNTGAINTVGWVQTTGNGNISLSATGGSATIGNSLITGNDNTSTGSLNVAATGAGSDIALNTINVYSGATGGGSGIISMNAGRNIALNPAELKTTGNLNLTAGGTITETGAGAIHGALLTTTSVGGTNLPNANVVASFNATNSGSGNIIYGSAVGGSNDLHVTVNNSGSGGYVKISEATGNINVAAASGAPGFLSLKAPGGTVTQSAGALLGFTALNAEGASVSLTEANPVGVISGAATAGDFMYKTFNGIAVNTVDGTAGINATGVVSLETTHATAGIMQNTGASIIASDGLTLVSNGPVNLMVPTNNVSTIAADLSSGTGSLSFRNNGDIWLGAITTTNNFIDLRVPTARTITVGGTIDTGTGTASTLKLTGGGIVYGSPAATANEIIAFQATDPLQGITLNGGVLGSPNTKMVDLVTDKLTLSGGTVMVAATAGSSIGISNFSANTPIVIGAGATPNTLYITDTNTAIINSPDVAIGSRSGDPNRAVSGSIAVNATISRAGGRVGLFSGGNVTQTAPIMATSLGVIAGGMVNLPTANQVASLAIEAGSGAINFANNGSLTVTSMTGGVNSPSTITGLKSAGGGDIQVVSSTGTITVAAPIVTDTAVGTVTLQAPSASIVDAAAGISIIAKGLDASASSGIGTITAPLKTQVSNLNALNSVGGDIAILNSGALTTDATTAITNSAGKISITTQSPLTIGAAGVSAGSDIMLTAGGPVWVTDKTGDDLTINGPVTSSAGNIVLTAGNTISGSGLLTASSGVVTMTANLNPTSAPPPPTLAQCTADPTLSGCSAVLPSLATCTTVPTTAGCSAVLPTLASCTADPTVAGCSAVLPSLATCTTAPTTAGCSAVLPTLASCTADPTAAGCSAVLPSLSTCTAAPTTAGCSAVLPTLAACTADPTAAGCSAVLPSVDTCAVTPTLPGCVVVLPSIGTCTVTPTLPGCSIVLPSVGACTLTPTLPGCSVVLPSLDACTVTPALPGCSVVLPSISVCTATPALPGCSAVLPSVGTCTLTPTLSGCSVVLPSLDACTVTPALPGCLVVLPSISACTVTPTLPGCSAVLPSVGTCTLTPTLPGCAVVLPSVDACTVTPTLPGCLVVLPSISACTVTPTLSGCSAVLPTLAQCTAIPTLAGCAVILPSVQNRIFEPVTQAINDTVNIINTVTTTVTAPTAPLFVSDVGQTPAAQSQTGESTPPKQDDKEDDRKEDKKTDKTEEKTIEKTGVKKDEPAKKTYCN